jgi:hypothetical protein
MQSVHFNIIGKSNGVGLSRDLSLLDDALRNAGHETAIVLIDRDQAKRRRSVVAQWRTRAAMLFRRRPPARVNIMLEHVWPQFLPAAQMNVAIPNPEWFDRHDRRFLPALNCVWAKTDRTREVFKALGCHTAFIGFDSCDRYLPDVRRERSFFHLAGKSGMKNTDRVLQVWARHPRWPPLIVIQHGKSDHLPDIRAGNIQRIVGYVNDAALVELQNRSRFHICPSRTEGWGHYIGEALSAAAVTISVDAPPMNELVTAGRGLLIPCSRTGMQRLATTYDFDEQAFEATLQAALAMSDEECIRLGNNARSWFLANKLEFPARLAQALRPLMSA